MILKEINIICVGDLRYRFDGENIRNWDFEFTPDVCRIEFKDLSFIEFNRHNIICIEFNKEIPTDKPDDELKIGDEVEMLTGLHKGKKGILMYLEERHYSVLLKSGRTVVGIFKEDLKKTGKHFDAINEIITGEE